MRPHRSPSVWAMLYHSHGYFTTNSPTIIKQHIEFTPILQLNTPLARYFFLNSKFSFELIVGELADNSSCKSCFIVWAGDLVVVPSLSSRVTNAEDISSYAGGKCRNIRKQTNYYYYYYYYY